MMNLDIVITALQTIRYGRAVNRPSQGLSESDSIDGGVHPLPTIPGCCLGRIADMAASGAVSDARVVSNTVGSSSLSQCALAQIREWQFPAVPSGTTVFRAPFVFTPPKE